jgi:tetratricopeptide (TPR) repeat protein
MKIIVAWIIGLCLLFSSNTSAQNIDKENSFFSYNRFYSQLDILENASRDEKARNDIRAFMRNLADGILAISGGDLKKAKTCLLIAREIWPEYFGTDFLLARVNEDTGNYQLAAKFYKSYLNNLKAFSDGRYRVSGPLMRGITPYRIEGYDDSYALVRHRLKEHGIDLAVVQPFEIPPGFLKYLPIFIILGMASAFVIYGLIPYVKRRHHINNPPEGHWVCKKCDAYNLNVRLECEKCGEKRDRSDGTIHNSVIK